MMKVYLFTILLAFSGAINAKFVKGEIHYLNGSVEVEFDIPKWSVSGNVKFPDLQNTVKYRDPATGKVIKLDGRNVEYFVFKYNRQEIKMRPVKRTFSANNRPADKTEYVFLRWVLDGKMNYYIYYHWDWYNMHEEEKPVFQKGDDGDCFKPSWTGYRRDMMNYFSDCPALVEKFDKKVYQWGNAIDAVKYYNHQCFEK